MRRSAFGVVDGVRLLAAAVVLCVLLGAGAAVAQEDKVPTFHAYTNLVQVPTLVLDQTGKPIVPIAESRFFISIDGGPKFRVTHARLEGEDPITLAILLDVSQPFPTLMRGIDDVIAGLVPGSLHERDRVSVYALDCKLLRTAVNAPANAATLKDAVNRALESWKANGTDRHRRDCTTQWNLWDAMAYAAQSLAGQPGRRVMLAVTNGVDRGSKSSLGALQEYAQERGVAIFGLQQPGDAGGLSRMGRPGQADSFRLMCEMSGGMVLTATQKELPGQLKWFTMLLRNRYIVEFPHPIDTVGGKHNMDITIDRLEPFIRASGISVPVDNPDILKDPMTIPADLTRVPQVGKRKVAAPH